MFREAELTQSVNEHRRNIPDDEIGQDMEFAEVSKYLQGMGCMTSTIVACAGASPTLLMQCGRSPR